MVKLLGASSRTSSGWISAPASRSNIRSSFVREDSEALPLAHSLNIALEKNSLEKDNLDEEKNNLYPRHSAQRARQRLDTNFDITFFNGVTKKIKRFIRRPCRRGRLNYAHQQRILSFQNFYKPWPLKAKRPHRRFRRTDLYGDLTLT